MRKIDKENQELTPVTYSTAAIKTLHFQVKENKVCFRIHWHDRVELLRIKNGSMIVELGNKSIHALKDEIVIIPPKIAHTAYTTALPLDYDVLMFDIRSFYNETELCKRILPIIADGRIHFNTKTNRIETLNCFDRICNHNCKDNLLTLSEIYRLLFYLTEYESNGIIQEKQNDCVQNAKAFLENNFMNENSTSELAAKFGYTTPHFCKKFKQATGLSPMQYLKILRLERAKKMIEAQEETIGEIAQKSGFDDQNYFARCFKNHFGCQPSAYKKIAKNQREK